MNGFDSLDPEQNIPDMTRLDLQRGIARGHELRAEQFAAWGRKVALTWASLFRRHGRLLPTHRAARARFGNAAQV